jgi:uncharacterized protein YuzE
MPTATYDSEADALYIRLADGQRDRTVEFDDSHYVDLDAAGNAIGIEILYPRMGLRLEKLAAVYGFSTGEVRAAIGAALGRTASTGASTFLMAPAIVTNVAVEGTVAAQETIPATSVSHAARDQNSRVTEPV